MAIYIRSFAIWVFAYYYLFTLITETGGIKLHIFSIFYYYECIPIPIVNHLLHVHVRTCACTYKACLHLLLHIFYMHTCQHASWLKYRIDSFDVGKVSFT